MHILVIGNGGIFSLPFFSEEFFWHSCIKPFLKLWSLWRNHWWVIILSDTGRWFDDGSGILVGLMRLFYFLLLEFLLLSFLFFLEPQVLVFYSFFVGFLLFCFSFCFLLHLDAQLLVSAVFLNNFLLGLFGFSLLFFQFSLLFCQVSQMFSLFLFLLSFESFLFFFFPSFSLLNLLFELFLNFEFSFLFNHVLINCLIFQFQQIPSTFLVYFLKFLIGWIVHLILHLIILDWR